jgi:chemotaxis protein CheD
MKEHLVSTVLGSCVAICLWDSTMNMGGINHYMLALWNGDGLPTPKYGNIAIEKLIQGMLRRGCSQGQIVAKMFGGGSVIGSRHGPATIGGRNIAIARETLAKEKIPIVAENVGGEFGRKIIYNTRTGVVLVFHLRPIDENARPIQQGSRLLIGI